MEENLYALRMDEQNELSAVDYHNLILDSLDEVSDERINSLGEIERDKLRVARAYNKRVMKNHFRSETLFGRQFCLLGQKATSSEVVAELERTVYNRGSNSEKFLYGSEHASDLETLELEKDR
jgi:hypothetical protein